MKFKRPMLFFNNFRLYKFVGLAFLNLLDICAGKNVTACSRYKNEQEGDHENNKREYLPKVASLCNFLVLSASFLFFKVISKIL